MKELSRRNYLKKSILSAGSILLVSNVAKASSCLLTPDQTEGPFYPIEDQLDKDRDLTAVKGSDKRALGETIIMIGIVTDESCIPVKGALVEIWQACATGKYNHPGDPNPAALDPNFQYWGRALTNSNGEYSFKTIRPGHYQATESWMRPAHIHLKVHRRGYEELTTQVYFKDDPYNSNDRILMALSENERDSVIIDFKKKTTQVMDGEDKYRTGRFNITIKNF
jgi:protocatechuate 3,4-dioxygenase beta subunit